MLLLRNDIVIEDRNFSDKIFEQGFSIYEVIRIFNGRPIFLQDNLNRLSNSIKKSNIKLDILNLYIPDKLRRFITLKHIREGNLKYVLHMTDNNTVINEYIYQIPHNYPTEKDYRNGVDTMTYHAVRKNPEIKYINSELRTIADGLIKENGVYEVLLTDDEGYITEGSRSNLFFIKGEILYTASTHYVLPGTSRKRILGICKENQVEVVEERVACTHINEYNAAFITGTSPLILPLRKIDQIAFDPQNQLLRMLMTYYFSLFEHIC